MSSGRVIDLKGPHGIAFQLMAYADDFLRQLGHRDAFEPMREEMMSGDYDNLVRIFEKNFSSNDGYGDFVTLVGKDGEEFDE